jgi:hypothetical protein
MTLLQLDIPVVLGPGGTLLAAIVILAQTVMAFYSWRRSNAVKILKDELEIYKGKVTRLEGDMQDVRESEVECQKKLDRLTALYLESKGQEEDERKREHRRRP